MELNSFNLLGLAATAVTLAIAWFKWDEITGKQLYDNRHRTKTIRRQLRAGIIPENLRLLPAEPLADYIDQLGIGPGPVKLAQFQAALKLRGTPALYAQNGQGDAAVVHVKLFDPCGSATWFLTEWDGQEEAFGFVTGLHSDEYGYVSLRELAFVPGHLGIGIEVETHFRPISLGKAKRKRI